jgi:hypothetical protein
VQPCIRNQLAHSTVWPREKLAPSSMTAPSTKRERDRPPISSRPSNTSTSHPASARRTAAHRPARPAPTTATLVIRPLDTNGNGLLTAADPWHHSYGWARTVTGKLRAEYDCDTAGFRVIGTLCHSLQSAQCCCRWGRNSSTR